MPVNRTRTLLQIFSALIIGTLLLGVPSSRAHSRNAAAFSQISFVANIETAGIAVSGANLPSRAQLSYRPNNDPNWHTGQPLVQIPDGRLIGSLFNLTPGASYEVKVTDGTTEITGTVTTQPDALPFAPITVLHVDSRAAAGGDGSASAPFQKIQDAVNQAGPGTQILVADGTYHESVSFPKSGTANQWIQVKAANGGAILDGSVDLADVDWKSHITKKNVYFIKASPITYLGRDQKRFYNYDDLSELTQGLGHNGVPISEGWYYEPGTGNLYIRSSSDPSKHSWQFPTLSNAFDINGQDWIWIEGFEIRFYGANYGCGICTTNASHTVIRLNRIHNIQLGVFTNWTNGSDRGNDTRIEYNEIYDLSVTDWPWAALKATSMEGTAIVIRGHTGTIVRGNDLHDIFNGIYTGTSASSAIENPEVAFDADIYNNHIHAIIDDGLEPEGANVNERFRDNVIDSSLAGISIAPITQGPAWVLRNLFVNFTGTSIKWDLNSDGFVFAYHNTSWTNVPNLNAMSLIHPVHNSVLRNNIFQGNGYAFAEPFIGSTGHDWNYDDWYTTRGSGGPHFQWEKVDYNTIAQLCSATGLECNGFEDAPGFSNPNGGDFTLLPGSPNIDRGVLLPGINDNFSGAAPDLGAFEYALQVPPAVQSITSVDTNPTNAAGVNFTVTFSKPVTGVDANDFALTTSGVTGASIATISLVSGTTYSVNVNTGTGSGTIRLDLIDNDSVLDNTNTPLGGPGAGNGNFNSGATYTIDKNLATVLGIVRADPNPTSANSVHFTVNFSTPVSGVDAGDFALTVTGNLTGASVAEISGSASAYNVTVNTGNGDGTLRLDLTDNDSIVNATNNPLGGPGAGNGNFTGGEVYTINKNAPTVTSILRADPDSTSAGSVRFLVSFSEPVTGVEASDFALSTNGISGASIINISGAGSQYVVTVATGSGSGTLRLDLFDNDSILDANGLPLGNAGAGNGNFTSGETYAVNKPVVTLVTQNFMSNGANDGWILESNRYSNKGGTKNSNGTIINLGDDSKNRQYRAILEFPTSALPDNAVITSAILMIKRQGLIGNDPFKTNGNILIDIRKGAFGNLGPFQIPALLASDFQAPADKGAVGMIANNPVSGWYWAGLDAAAFPYINLSGITQFRLRFQLDDNNNKKDDYLKFFSGNYASPNERPQLIINYYVSP